MSAGVPYPTVPGCILYSGESDTGILSFETVMHAAAIGVAAYNTAAAIKMADLQIDLARLYLNIAKGWRNYYNNTFKPIENEELAEAQEFQPYTPKYDVAVGRAKTYVKSQLGEQFEEQMRCTSAYCSGMRKTIFKDGMNREAQAIASAAGMGYRNERAYMEAQNDLIWNRKTDVVNRGRSYATNNIKFGNLAAGIFGDLGEQARAGAAGAMKYLGYDSTRQRSRYPMKGQNNFNAFSDDWDQEVRPVYPTIPIK